MTRIAERLQELGVAPRWVEWPNAPPGGDAADFIDTHGDGVALDRLLTEARLWTPEARAEGALRFTRLGDLLVEPPEDVAWLVEDHLPTGGLSILAGKPKAGKSTLARCLALAVARGEPWLGFVTAQGLVLYLALEEKRAEVRAHFAAMGAGPDDAVEVFIAPSPQDGLEQLRRAAAARRSGLIVVDPLLKMIRLRDGNDYAEVIRALEPLLILARESGAHVLAVHHLGKGERSGGDAILGSTAFFAAVDTALLLRRGDRYRTLSSIQRYGPDLEETVLALDPVTRWITAGPSRQEADVVAMVEAILEFLSAQPAPVEEVGIREAVEGRRAIQARALRRLVEEGRVLRTGQGRKGDPYLYASRVSGFLVPSICREPAEPESETGQKPSPDATISGSRVSEVLPLAVEIPGTRNATPRVSRACRRCGGRGFQRLRPGLHECTGCRSRRLIVRKAQGWRCVSSPEQVRRATAGFYQRYPDRLPPLARRALAAFDGRVVAVKDVPPADGAAEGPP